MAYYKNLISIIRRALREDIGKKDITTELIIPKNKLIKAVLLAKEPCVVCGLDIARLVFQTKDNNIEFKPRVCEGEYIKKGRVIAKIKGEARAILTAERVALNFLSLLSGIATTARLYVNKIKPYKVKLMDTRKTLPGLRELEKYAVRISGGYNHRMRLDEMILVKDNHLKVTGGFQRFPKVSKGYKYEIEVKNLKEFREALKAKPDIIMLDNMNLGQIRKAVMIERATHSAKRKTLLEVSGGITLKNIREIAATGIDMISVGELTDSVKSIDMSLEVL